MLTRTQVEIHTHSSLVGNIDLLLVRRQVFIPTEHPVPSGWNAGDPEAAVPIRQSKKGILQNHDVSGHFHVDVAEQFHNAGPVKPNATLYISP